MVECKRAHSRLEVILNLTSFDYLIGEFKIRTGVLPFTIELPMKRIACLLIIKTHEFLFY